MSLIESHFNNEDILMHVNVLSYEIQDLSTYVSKNKARNICIHICVGAFVLRRIF